MPTIFKKNMVKAVGTFFIINRTFYCLPDFGSLNLLETHNENRFLQAPQETGRYLTHALFLPCDYKRLCAQKVFTLW